MCQSLTEHRYQCGQCLLNASVAVNIDECSQWMSVYHRAHKVGDTDVNVVSAPVDLLLVNY